MKAQVNIEAPLIDAEELALLTDQAKQIKPTAGYKHRLESLFSGTLPTKKIGSGMDFAESRVYQTGDDPRFINWRLTARSNETLVKNFHTESSPIMCIFMDRGSTMRFGTRRRLKITQAARVSSILSLASKQHRLALGGLIVDESESSLWFPASKNEQAYNSWIDKIASACPPFPNNALPTLKSFTQIQSSQLNSKAQSWHIILQNLADKNPIGSVIYLVSDFAGLNAEHQTMLETLQAQHYVVAIHISDPAEHELVNNGAVRFKDALTSVIYPVKTSSVKQREQFQSRSQKYQKSIKKLFEDRGISYILISTVDDDLAPLLPLPLEAL